MYSVDDRIKDIGVRNYFRPFSIILDSFQNKIQQKLFFINQIFFSSKMAKEVPYNKYEF
jgi:hypothetical protein